MSNDLIITFPLNNYQIIENDSSGGIIEVDTVQSFILPIEPVEVVISPLGTQGLQGVSSAPTKIDFTGQTIIPVQHNRGYRPIVTVTNLSGDEIGVNVNHVNFNMFNVEFNSSQSGSIAYI